MFSMCLIAPLTAVFSLSLFSLCFSPSSPIFFLFHHPPLSTTLSWHFFSFSQTLWSSRQGHTLYSWQSAVCGAVAGAGDYMLCWERGGEGGVEGKGLGWMDGRTGRWMLDRWIDGQEGSTSLPKTTLMQGFSSVSSADKSHPLLHPGFAKDDWGENEKMNSSIFLTQCYQMAKVSLSQLSAHSASDHYSTADFMVLSCPGWVGYTDNQMKGREAWAGAVSGHAPLQLCDILGTGA